MARTFESGPTTFVNSAISALSNKTDSSADIATMMKTILVIKQSHIADIYDDTGHLFAFGGEIRPR